MPSNKQLEANRANARKSTGPRTEAGKARSRPNSRKHGLTAKTLIIVGENASDFDELRTELLREYDPQSALECEFVERLAGIFGACAVCRSLRQRSWMPVIPRLAPKQEQHLSRVADRGG